MSEMVIRDYQEADWPGIQRVHDSARKIELALAGLEEAFLPLAVAAEREGLLDYPGLFVAERAGEVLGFAACGEEELAWLYVEPRAMRQGIGSALARHCLEQFPDIGEIEALKGNEPARALYESLGFQVAETQKGRMPGNEDFPVEVYVLRRK